MVLQPLPDPLFGCIVVKSESGERVVVFRKRRGRLRTMAAAEVLYTWTEEIVVGDQITEVMPMRRLHHLLLMVAEGFQFRRNQCR